MGSGSQEFAVVDVETTGLFPGGTDRILEIAVVRVRSDGTVLDEYCTLVNANRDVGPTHLHGIRAGDILDAPVFEEIAGDLIQRLKGAVFVAHNVSFDARFVRAEMERAGYDLPDFPQLCTLQLSRVLDPAIPSRRLSALCAYFGIELPQAHSAHDDAHAAANLLARCLRDIGWTEGMPGADIGVRGTAVDMSQWPRAAPTGRSFRRREARGRRSEPPPYLERLLGNLPPTTQRSPETDAYLALLDRVLEDRRVTMDEGDALQALAVESGLSRMDIAAFHDAYLSGLLHAAFEDEVITESEATDLEEVRCLLGIEKGRAKELESLARESSASRADRRSRDDLRGKSVCFTGTLQCIVRGARATRSQAEEAATAAGMAIRKGVSKNLDLLILADPDSMSGKAKRARALGVRLVAELVYWRMVGEQVE